MKINATDLDQFAHRREAQGLLPELIRRLIRVSAPRHARVSFPGGDSISHGGWDGIAHVPEETYLAPSGCSYWELTAQATKIGNKATRDYKKRVNQTDDVERAQAAFIVVSLHRWSGKEAWEKKKRSQKNWQEVRAYDADDIEEWLDNSPAVQLWLGWEMGQYPHDARSLDEYWETWRAATNPPLSAKVVLAGRSSQQQKLAEYLKRPASLVSVKGFSRDESVSFVAAVTDQIDPAHRAEILARAVIVSKSTSWRELVFCTNNLILIPDFMPAEGVEGAVNHGHHVILPQDPSASHDPHAILLGKPACEELVAALEELELPKGEANRRVRESNGRIGALRRLIAVAPSAQAPHWSAPKEGVPLLPLLLAGSWEGSDSDRLAIEQLAHRPYREILAELTRLQNMSDPPLHRTGDSWRWNSRYDSWQLLSRYLTSENLEDFEEVALDVLGENDPSWELPPHEWGMAAVRGKTLTRSDLLRKGLAETLALLGASEEERVKLPIALPDWASRIVCQLLEEKHWQRWVSLASLLPLLAEAAPATFLTAAEDVLSEQEALDRLFLEGGMLGTHSAHTGLLWALELCAWHPQYLTRVTLILGTLARLDPKGRPANRPARSLRQIFLGWCPQTRATLQQRLAALDTLYRKEPEVGWHLLIELLPTGVGSTSSPTYQPQWRDWGAEWPPIVKDADYLDHINGIASRVLERVQDDGGRWLQLLEKLNVLSTEHRTQAINCLQEVTRELEEEVRLKLRESLRKLLSHHRSYPEQNWSLDATALGELESVYQLLKPINPKERYGWLFSYHPDLPDGERRDWKKQEALVDAERRSVVEALLSERDDAEFFLDFAEFVEAPFLLGFALGRVKLAQTFTQHLIDGCLEGTPPLHELLAGVVASLLKARGWEWVCEEVERLNKCTGEVHRVAFLCTLPFDQRTWKLVRNEGLSKFYWSQVRAGYTPARAESTEEAVEELVKANRPWAALHLAGMHLNPKEGQALPAPILLEVLTATTQTRPEEEQPRPETTLLDYHVGKILDYLETTDEVGRDRLAQLEFRFFYFLEHRRQPRLLHKELARSPDMFAEIIGWVYKPHNRDKSKDESPSEEWAQLGKLGFHLLHEWKRIPGSDKEENINVNQLKDWIEKARELCRRADRSEVGDIHIGQILAHAPPDEDGIWPATPIREVIEELANRSIESGMSTQISNNRGVTMRAIGEGGGQERELAQVYQDNADTLRDRWPRTAAILDGVAESYRRHGRMWDINAERDLV